MSDNTAKIKPGIPGSTIETLSGRWTVETLQDRRYVVSETAEGCWLTYRLKNGAPVLEELHVTRQMTATELGRLKRGALSRLTQFLHEGK